ncbi:enoyl-CoA hydratase/isomerase family protein [Streptomyces hirsutus]|uniref:enoyl-CoA hydratase/isomerase family protein n=1 Tax=Streptomyces hirsutus TaxID=35620 RepID=UPI00362806C3
MAITLTRERNGCVAHIRYDNAARGNSFDGELLGKLVDTLEAAALDPMCSVIRLDMAGRHFCGGWDTTSFGDLSASTTESVAAALRSSDEMLGRIRRLPVPVVAGVRGQVIGFGAGLLSAVHLPVAAADTRLSLPEVRFGFAPAGVGHTIAQALPRAQAYALLTGATTASGSQLLAWGLVARVVPETELETAVHELVETLAAVPGQALRAVVKVVESSLATGSADESYLASARTIVAGVPAGGVR